MYARTITFANPAASCGQRVYHVLPGNRQVNVESYIPGTWYLDTAEHPIARICNKALTSPINRLRESLRGGRREIGSREAALPVGLCKWDIYEYVGVSSRRQFHSSTEVYRLEAAAGCRPRIYTPVRRSTGLEKCVTSKVASLRWIWSRLLLLFLLLSSH